MLLNGSELVAWTAGMKTWSLPIDKILKREQKYLKWIFKTISDAEIRKKSKSIDKKDNPFKDGID